MGPIRYDWVEKESWVSRRTGRNIIYRLNMAIAPHLHILRRVYLLMDVPVSPNGRATAVLKYTHMCPCINNTWIWIALKIMLRIHRANPPNVPPAMAPGRKCAIRMSNFGNRVTLAVRAYPFWNSPPHRRIRVITSIAQDSERPNLCAD